MERLWNRVKYHLYPPYRRKVDAIAKSLIIPGLIDEMFRSYPLFRMLIEQAPPSSAPSLLPPSGELEP